MRGILRPNGGNYEARCGNEIVPIRGIMRPLAETWLIVAGSAAERRGSVSETNPDKHGSWTLSATRDCRRGEWLVTACCRNALPCAIPDCRDRTPAPQRRRATSTPPHHPRLCHIIENLIKRQSADLGIESNARPEHHARSRSLWTSVRLSIRVYAFELTHIIRHGVWLSEYFYG